MLRLPVIFGMVLLGMAMLVSVGETQDTKKVDDKKVEDKKAKPKLPDGFKDLGLSADQKSKILAVQLEARNKIHDLENQIRELKLKENQDCFKVLTADQREKYLKAK